MHRSFVCVPVSPRTSFPVLYSNIVLPRATAIQQALGERVTKQPLLDSDWSNFLLLAAENKKTIQKVI